MNDQTITLNERKSVFDPIWAQCPHCGMTTASVATGRCPNCGWTDKAKRERLTGMTEAQEAAIRERTRKSASAIQTEPAQEEEPTGDPFLAAHIMASYVAGELLGHIGRRVEIGEVKVRAILVESGITIRKARRKSRKPNTL